MKTLFLNLPYPKNLIRRFISSYYAPNFLFPPHELLYLATIIKKWKKDPFLFIDAIASKQDVEKVLDNISCFMPDIIVTYLGHFSFNSDLKTINHIKTDFPKIKIIGTGFLPTVFPKEILENSAIDIIIKGEPESTFLLLYDSIKNKLRLADIDGIAFKNGSGIINNPPFRRIENPDEIPFPDLSILDKNLHAYSEPYLEKPFTTITTGRGCIHNCSFCIHTYGNKVYNRSLKNVFEEIDYNFKNHGIKNIRFLDDTFTLDKKRTLEICKFLKERNIAWTCLSRVDTLDEKLASYMKNSGCKRVYLGVESGSQNMLDVLNKGIDKHVLKERLKQIKKSGLELSCFFITGIPQETDGDLYESIGLAIEADLDYVVVKKLKIWPGTGLYEKYNSQISLKLFPFENRFKNETEEQKAVEREKLFYRKFYLRPKYIGKKIKILFKHPGEITSGFLGLLKFIFLSSEKSGSDEKDFI